MKKLGLDADADITTALTNFKSDTATNDITIPDTWPELAHLKGESSCCNDTYLLLLRKVS